MISVRLKSLLGAAAVAIAGSVFTTTSASASIETCGNKSFHATQDGTDLSYTDTFSGKTGICGNLGGKFGNSTGANSPIAAAGWISGSEVQGSNPDGASGQGDGTLTLSIMKNTWSILNPFSYAHVGLSIKHGNGFIFYVLDLAKPLTGDWFTYESATGPAGKAFSHINAWYMGEPNCPSGNCPPVDVVPVPAGLPLILTAIGALGILSRRKSRKAA